MIQEDVYERLAVLERRVDDHGKKLDKQEDKNESQIELNTLLKLQIETSKENSKQMEKFSDTLDRVNENLTGLNTGMQDLNTRVTEIENNQESKKIDPSQLFKNIVYHIVPALILAWLLVEFGLK